MYVADRKYFDAVGATLIWAIWNFRNHLLFTQKKPLKSKLWDFIFHSFFWITARNHNWGINWMGWLQNPNIAISSL